MSCGRLTLAGGAELEALVLRVAVGGYPEGARAGGGAVAAVGARMVRARSAPQLLLYTHLVAFSGTCKTNCSLKAPWTRYHAIIRLLKKKKLYL